MKFTPLKRLQLICLFFYSYDCWPFKTQSDTWYYLEGKRKLGYKLRKKEQQILERRELMIQMIKKRFELEKKRVMMGLEPQEIDVKEIVNAFGGF